MSNLIVADTHDKIEMYRLLSLKGALRLEIVGLKRRGRSAYALIKDEFGFKGNREKVLEQFNTSLKLFKNFLTVTFKTELLPYNSVSRAPSSLQSYYLQSE